MILVNICPIFLFIRRYKVYVVQVVTGLLIAEVNVKTMCELGSGGVSLVISTLLS